MRSSLGIGGAWKIGVALLARRQRSCPRKTLSGSGQAVARGRLVLTLVVMAGMVCAVVLRSGPAWGQDDWDAPKQAANQPGARNVMGARVMGPADFDQWVFGGKTRSQIEQTLESQLALQVDSVASACGLSDAQRKKLQLAGQGDVKRFSRSVDQLKEKFRQVGQDQQKFNDIAREASPLRMKMQTGVFDDSSLYRKILKQTLDPGQVARYEEQQRQRRKFLYEAKIELVLSNLESTLPLRAEQRQRLVKLILDETEPPKKFGQYDYYIVLYQAKKVGEAKLKPIFDDVQWKTFKRALDHAQGMEFHLR